MAGILDNLVQLNQMGVIEPTRPPLQINPVAATSGLGGILGGGRMQPTPLTMRWRNMVRGQDRIAAEGADAARAQIQGQPLDAYQQQLITMPWVQGILGKLQQYNTAEAWQRRALASKPEAQFDIQGNLSNFDQLKALYGGQ